MALSMNAPKGFNWRLWGGTAAAVIVILAAAGYWFDWYGTGAPDAAVPAIEQPAPISQ